MREIILIGEGLEDSLHEALGTKIDKEVILIDRQPPVSSSNYRLPSIIKIPLLPNYLRKPIIPKNCKLELIEMVFNKSFGEIPYEIKLSAYITYGTEKSKYKSIKKIAMEALNFLNKIPYIGHFHEYNKSMGNQFTITKKEIVNGE